MWKRILIRIYNLNGSCQINVFFCAHNTDAWCPHNAHQYCGFRIVCQLSILFTKHFFQSFYEWFNKNVFNYGANTQLMSPMILIIDTIWIFLNQHSFLFYLSALFTTAEMDQLTWGWTMHSSRSPKLICC